MKPQEQNYGKLSALEISPEQKVDSKPQKAIVLLHGVGSNEQDILELASTLSEEHLIVSLRAPIVLSTNGFAWFHVQFKEQGPVHNWSEAKESFILLEEAILEVSKKSGIPLDKISIFGFSQGAIMTIGLALTSKLNLENYFALSGRTLPEFAVASQEHPLSDYSSRRIYVTHGIQDSVLPVALGRNTEKILKSTALNLTYKEYNSDHTISRQVLVDVKEWLGS